MSTGTEQYPQVSVKDIIDELMPSAEMRAEKAERTLRDWFAGMAMQRLVYFDGKWTADQAAELLGDVAKQAYAVADAMMKARET